MGKTRQSSQGLKPYDPRDFQLAAQTQAIYEQLAAEGKPFRTRTGLRTDRNWPQAKVRGLLSRAFAIATGSEKRVAKPKRIKGTRLSVAQQPWLRPEGRVPTARTAKASQERYVGAYVGSDGERRTLTDLVNTRQAYEETLGLARQGKNFYRVVPEPTRAGIRYFVWPMPPGCYDVGPGTASLVEARAIAADLNHRGKGATWKPSSRRYTKTQLAHWLPPASAFTGRQAAKPKRTRRRRTA